MRDSHNRPLHIDPMTWRKLGDDDLRRPPRVSSSVTMIIISAVLLAVATGLVWWAGRAA